MNGRRNLARSARHSAVRHQPHPKAAILKYPQIRREFVQLRHAIGFRTLKAHHNHAVTIQITCFKGGF